MAPACAAAEPLCRLLDSSACYAIIRPMRSIIPAWRDRVLAHAARILIRSGTFRRHLAALDATLDPDFLQAAGLIRNASDEDALFVRDLVSDTKSFAQLRQDLWVLHETRHKRNGYFVEFGAADGVNLSNTCLLEREFGWRGILAEPNPVWHAALKQNRKTDIDLRCVFGRSGERVAFAATKHPELATIVGYESNDGHRLARQDHTIVEIETVALNDLLAQHNSPQQIDYISIDTEGSEFDILAPFDFARWNVTLFSVEHNATGVEQKLDRLMQRHGYERRYPGISKFDAWYRKMA
jgi:FkbM family methyltransferase